jgi:fructose-1,6-bisphosphatase II
MDRNIALDFVRVTEDAAVASSHWVGKGDKNKADDAAVKMMRARFNSVDIDGTVVIGEGERDEAPMLYIGEKVGSGNGIKVDIAVDPLECTNSVAYGRMNAMSVLAAAPKGTLLHAPDTYMNKIAVSKEAKDKISIDADVEYNLTNLAHALGKKVKDITVMVLERERHKKLIEDIRKCDARIMLIPDGDISAAIAPSIQNSGVDILMGIGAAPEGVLAATALSCLGGYMEGKFAFRNDEERERAKKMGVKKLDGVMKIKDLVDTDNAIFAATGVTDGPFLRGVRFTKEGAITHSIVTRSKSKTLRFIEGYHVYNEVKK